MARIKWNTEYSTVRINYLVILAGSFFLIDVRGSLFFHDSAAGKLVPINIVLEATEA